MQAEIDSKLAIGLRCSDRATGLGVDANPVQIYFNLGMDRVHYVPQASLLYFANSSHFPIQDIIDAVYAGFGETPKIEQLFLDEHGYYKGAQRVEMTTDNARAVMVALRLRDIKISIATDTKKTEQASA
jgi:hypothetical protein